MSGIRIIKMGELREYTIPESISIGDEGIAHRYPFHVRVMGRKVDRVDRTDSWQDAQEVSVRMQDGKFDYKDVGSVEVRRQEKKIFLLHEDVVRDFLDKMEVERYVMLGARPVIGRPYFNSDERVGMLDMVKAVKIDMDIQTRSRGQANEQHVVGVESELGREGLFICTAHGHPGKGKDSVFLSSRDVTYGVPAAEGQSPETLHMVISEDKRWLRAHCYEPFGLWMDFGRDVESGMDTVHDFGKKKHRFHYTLFKLNL
jgi:hypothetical protein